MAEEPVPIFTTLQEAHPIASIAAREAVRWNDLVTEFISRFGHPPKYIARAPGRVNLIGEHIDYALFGVFPTAVEQDILIACARRPEDTVKAGHVNAHNLHPTYPPQAFSPMLKTNGQGQRLAAIEESAAAADVHLYATESHTSKSWHLDIDKTQLRWESYVKAGYYGVLERFFDPSKVDTSDPQTHPVPVDILVSGSVPAGSGLSSSAAMVVASTLAFLAVNNKLKPDQTTQPGSRRLTKGELVEMAVENERRVGVNSGGMDQAASVTSLPTSALYISFFPTFNAEPIPLPITKTDPPAVLVCANSLVVSDKVVGAKTRYNLRVVETLVAARILARQLSLDKLLPASYPTKKFTLREVLSAYLDVDERKGTNEPALTPAQLKDGLERLLVEAERLRATALKGSHHEGEDAGEDHGLTMEQMVEFSGLGSDEFQDVYLSWVEVEASRFQLYKRTKHVLTEALRVLQFREVCLSSSATDSSSETLPEHILHILGDLMNASQESCSSLFECSCPELDQLTTIARDAGAYGSRLTGAGWGGCTVSLVRASDVPTFVAKIKAAYPPYRDLNDEQLSQVIFATQPSSGAFVFKVEE